MFDVLYSFSSLRYVPTAWLLSIWWRASKPPSNWYLDEDTDWQCGSSSVVDRRCTVLCRFDRWWRDLLNNDRGQCGSDSLSNRVNRPHCQRGMSKAGLLIDGSSVRDGYHVSGWSCLTPPWVCNAALDKSCMNRDGAVHILKTFCNQVWLKL